MFSNIGSAEIMYNNIKEKEKEKVIINLIIDIEVIKAITLAAVGFEPTPPKRLVP